MQLCISARPEQTMAVGRKGLKKDLMHSAHWDSSLEMSLYCLLAFDRRYSHNCPPSRLPKQKDVREATAAITSDRERPVSGYFDAGAADELLVRVGQWRIFNA